MSRHDISNDRRDPRLHEVVRSHHVLAALLVVSFAAGRGAAGQVPGVPLLADPDLARPERDWLAEPGGFPARVRATSDGAALVLTNGLVARTIRITPDAATVAFDDLVSGAAILRSVRPEALLTLDGVDYEVGGLVGQTTHNFLTPETIATLAADPKAFRFERFEVSTPSERFPWRRRTSWMSTEPAWPPPGVSLTLHFLPPPGAPDVRVAVRYELHDDLPLVSKRLLVENRGARAVRLDRFSAELLAVVETGSTVGGVPDQGHRDFRALHVETDYAFGGAMDAGGDNPSVHFELDPKYLTQVHYERRTPCLLRCAPPLGPALDLAPGAEWASFTVFELVHDGTDRERRGLALRRFYRAVAPWIAENPLIFHVRSAEDAAVRSAIEQAAETGFELVLMTFGSGFDIEDAKGIALGGYSLLASRSVSADDDVVNPKTGKPGGFATFGQSPCLGSRWGQAYFAKLRNFYDATGLDVLEHDGSYPGDVCASTSHPGHRGLDDSQWTQWSTIAAFYRECRGKGISLNVPDWYFLSGSNKTGMGYRETNWSLPREEQLLIERQNIYDGTWTKTPSMGWMFVPLTEYHGGGARATIEPLDEHLDHYEARFANLLGAGVQACYRGPRLYDSERTKVAVVAWVSWFKRHRSLLEADVIHGRRADGRNVDWLLHVRPGRDPGAMLVAYNPRPHPVAARLRLDFFYSGLRGRIRGEAKDGSSAEYRLDDRCRCEIPVSLPAAGMTAIAFTPAP